MSPNPDLYGVEAALRQVYGKCEQVEERVKNLDKCFFSRAEAIRRKLRKAKGHVSEDGSRSSWAEARSKDPKGTPLSVRQGGQPRPISKCCTKNCGLRRPVPKLPPSSLSKKNELAIRSLEWRVKETEEISDSHEAIFKVHRGDIDKVEQEIAQVWECLNSDRGPKAPTVLPSPHVPPTPT